MLRSIRAISSRIEDLSRRKFLFAPSFESYTSPKSGLLDYGPLLTTIQSNVLAQWRRQFIVGEGIYELDCSILTPEDVLKASGHVDRFCDLGVSDSVTGDVYRVDHLIRDELSKWMDPEANAGIECIDNMTHSEMIETIQKYDIKSPLGNILSEPEEYNLMFATSLGRRSVTYLRPETSQAQFLNFKRLLDFNHGRLFASACIGKSFRNEISPRGLLRVREFTMAEIEHYVDPDDKSHPRFDEVSNVKLSLIPNTSMKPVDISVKDAVDSSLINSETLAYYLARAHQFLLAIGITPAKIRFRQHHKTEMAHYANDCWDAELETSQGWIECIGCADRGSFDLERHAQATGADMIVREQLKEPVILNLIKATVDKKLAGPVFKGDIQLIQDTLDSMTSTGLQRIRNDLAPSKQIAISYIKDNQPLTAMLSADMLAIHETTEKKYVREYVPHIIEPSFGIGRILYACLEHNYYTRTQDKSRNVLGLPISISPTKVFIAPLSSQSSFNPLMMSMQNKLRKLGISTTIDSSSGNIGRKYARNDEIGTALGITIDFQSLKDESVTLRDRDTMQQIRASSEHVVNLVSDLVDERKTWNDVVNKYTLFNQDSDFEK